ncbi:MAG: hypothetical protein IJO58_03430 [Clostridia bacterium]|nr:hypothetical protein [Clostridia bacterium]
MNRTRIISFILSVAMLLCISACDEKDNTVSTSDLSGVDTDTSSAPEEFTPIYFDTDIWRAVPLVTQDMLDRGIEGGEGCQAIIYVTFAPDGKTVLMGTDVGGLYKSVDAGESYYPVSIGLKSAGAVGMAFDPNNQERVLLAGANSGHHEANGIYYSDDTGETWEYVYTSRAKNYRNHKSQIAWDESSYDESIGGSKIAYWSKDKESDNDSTSLIYRSETGGKSWQPIKTSGKYADGYVYVNKNTGALAAANDNGLYISNDKGETFETVLDDRVLSLDYVRTEPNSLFATIYSEKDQCHYLAVSKNFGKTWHYTPLNMSMPTYMRVSPVNTDRMVLMDDTITSQGKYPGYVYSTSDGGKTWTNATRNASNSSVPANSDNVKFAWSPTEEKTVLASWCFMCKSTDGGINFEWSNNGYNGICPAGMTNFNVNNSNLIYYASQDYNGAFSKDGGRSWKYMRWDGKGWGGWTYGGYVINENTVVTGVADRMFGEITMWITYDGGENFQSLNMKVNGSRIGCGVIGSDKIAFFGEYRTDDGGHTWKQMDGCTGVYTLDYSGSGALFGVNNGMVVVSTDDGITWKKIVAATGISDIAYNYKSKELFIASGTSTYDNLDYKIYKGKLDDNFELVGYLKPLEIEQIGTNNVCIDPRNPDIMYAGCSSNYYFDLKAVWRSLDGGKNWTLLTRQKGDGREGPDGGKKPVCMRVNAKTSELFTFNGCRGVWKIAAPPEEYYS